MRSSTKAICHGAPRARLTRIERASRAIDKTSTEHRMSCESTSHTRCPSWERACHETTLIKWTCIYISPTWRRSEEGAHCVSVPYVRLAPVARICCRLMMHIYPGRSCMDLGIYGLSLFDYSSSCTEHKFMKYVCPSMTLR